MVISKHFLCKDLVKIIQLSPPTIEINRWDPMAPGLGIEDDDDFITPTMCFGTVKIGVGHGVFPPNHPFVHRVFKFSMK